MANKFLIVLSGSAESEDHAHAIARSLTNTQSLNPLIKHPLRLEDVNYDPAGDIEFVGGEQVDLDVDLDDRPVSLKEALTGAGVALIQSFTVGFQDAMEQRLRLDEMEATARAVSALHMSGPKSVFAPGDLPIIMASMKAKATSDAEAQQELERILAEQKKKSEREAMEAAERDAAKAKADEEQRQKASEEAEYYELRNSFDNPPYCHYFCFTCLANMRQRKQEEEQAERYKRAEAERADAEANGLVGEDDCCSDCKKAAEYDRQQEERDPYTQQLQGTELYDPSGNVAVILPDCSCPTCLAARNGN